MPFGLLKAASSRLERIDVAVATMGGVVEQQVADAIDAFERGDVELAADVERRDLLVDEHERSIEREVVRNLEDGKVGAADLRRGMTAVKLAAEMERVGDLAKNVARRTTVLSSMKGDDAGWHVVPVVARMGRRALTQFAESLDSLFRSNAAAARAVRDADDQIDDLYNSIFREILLNMGQHAAGVVTGTHLIFVAKNFERIGDHATNIAERVHYTLTGHELTGERAKTDITSTVAAWSR